MQPVYLTDLDSNCALGLEARGPGSYIANYAARGDGLYSTLFVKSVSPGATLQIDYTETTLGPGDGELIPLASHVLVDDTTVLPFNDHVCIPKFHNNPKVTATVTGGTVEFGIYTSSKQISNLDAILAPGGGLPVDILGTPFDKSGTVASDQTEKEVFSFAVPAGVTRRLYRLNASACNEGFFELRIVGGPDDGKKLAILVTTPSNASVSFKFDPYQPIVSGTTVKLFHTANDDNDPAPVFGFISGMDLS